MTKVLKGHPPGKAGVKELKGEKVERLKVKRGKGC
jgi:hypothetical protein